VIPLRASGLGKSFGPVRALSGLDLDVAAGEIMAVLGPSGCGKTTLLRLIAGFERADAGRITLGDEVVTGDGCHVPAPRRRVGYVAQEGALFPHLDVACNITFGLRPGERRRRAGVAELLELVGLEETYARRRPHELSGGQQQRVAVARALAPRPPIVLLDEPFASLDAGLRQSTGRAVAEALRTQGATVLLVTHDQSEALSLADRVAVMRDGRVAQVGSPREVYERPADPAVATFVGSALLLPATLTDGVATCVLGDLPVAGPLPGSTRVDLLIRPEQVEMSADPGGGDGVAAGVLGVSYFGHDAEVRLRLANPGLELVAWTRGPDVPDRGERVRLTVAGPVLAFVPGEAPTGIGIR
jgi:iron(III) transport system ATP-binding protein